MSGTAKLVVNSCHFTMRRVEFMQVLNEVTEILNNVGDGGLDQDILQTISIQNDQTDPAVKWRYFSTLNL